MTKYPWWKYTLIALVLLAGLIYAAPNLFGDDPAVQISATGGQSVNQGTLVQVDQILQQGGFVPKAVEMVGQNLLQIRFNSVTDQLKARDYIKAALGDDYTVALNLASSTPAWLQTLGAAPMKLGLDLRGGVHMLIAVDVDSVLSKRLQQDARSISGGLREADIRYAGINTTTKGQIAIQFRDAQGLNQAEAYLKKSYPEFIVTEPNTAAEPFTLHLQLSPNALTDVRNYVIDQTMEVLRKRVNALGVSEAIVQRQGATHIVVDLPGIQDTARAKQILGGTATIELHMVDENATPSALANGQAPVGSSIYKMSQGDVPIALKNRVVLSGNAIVGATSSYGEDGRPVVNIRIAGAQVSLFHRVTGENQGKRMGIVYIETVPTSRLVDGTVVQGSKRIEKVISAPVIQSALGSSFQITGVESPQVAQNLALLLRSGALPASLSIIEESTVGPSLGQKNIEQGLMSVLIGFGLIVVFMLLYYRLFGLVANLALAFNLVLVVALLSLLGATLTLPGIAGLVLTVGMAVDANVLIFERIREELRNGMSAHASIHAGYEKALATIIDSNVTTLIVAVILFALGSGSVKGFAITLILGLLTSMFTAITGSRAMVHLLYGNRVVKRLSIGISTTRQPASPPIQTKQG